MTNLAPEGGSPGIESLDLVTMGVSGRVILPLGVRVSAVRANDDARVSLDLVLDDAIQRSPRRLTHVVLLRRR